MIANTLFNVANRLSINTLTSMFQYLKLLLFLQSHNLNDLLFPDAFKSIVIPPQIKFSSQVQVAEPANSLETRKNVFDNVNKQIQQQNEGRLFAVVHLCGKQFKVTAGDIILVEGYWPPSTGDKIRLDKVKISTIINIFT